jgi:hypothetical protein
MSSGEDGCHSGTVCEYRRNLYARKVRRNVRSAAVFRRLGYAAQFRIGWRHKFLCDLSFLAETEGQL